MPVSEQVRVDTHTGNGSTTVFAYGYRIFADTDLEVRVDDVLQTLTTDYTVTGANDAGGGTVVFVTAPINLSVVTISGELAYDRSTDYLENGPMLAETVDADLDKAVMLIQQLRRDVNRAIKVPIEETTDQEVSDIPSERANKILGFDASGLPVAESLTDLSTTLSTVDASLVLSSSQLSVAIPNRQAVAAGTVDAITAVFSPVIAALANNIEVIIEASGANTIVAPTFAPDGLPAKDIIRDSGAALLLEDIPGANYRAHLVFDATLDKWVLLNPANHQGLYVAGKVGVQGSLIIQPASDASDRRVIVRTRNTANTAWIVRMLLLGGDLADMNWGAVQHYDFRIPSGQSIFDGLGKAIIKVISVGASAINHLKVTNAATGNDVILEPTGDANSDLKLRGAGTGVVDIDGPPKFTGGALGAWDAAKVKDTDYLAATDLMVCVYWTPPGVGLHIVEARTDNNSTPTTVRMKSSRDGVAGAPETFMFPVKKGDYWKVQDVTAAATVTINVIPLGAA